jgi:hypothetical protein
VTNKDRLQKLSTKSDVPRAIADCKMYVDRFHHKNHKVTDKFCQENCNPDLAGDLLGKFSASDTVYGSVNLTCLIDCMSSPLFYIFIYSSLFSFHPASSNTLLSLCQYRGYGADLFLAEEPSTDHA